MIGMRQTQPCQGPRTKADGIQIIRSEAKDRFEAGRQHGRFEQGHRAEKTTGVHGLGPEGHVWAGAVPRRILRISDSGTPLAS